MRGVDRRRARELGETLVGALRSRNVGFLAAAVAYYAFVSLVPLLLLALSIGSFVGGEALAESAVAAAGDLLAPSGEDVLYDALVGADGRTGATLAGVALLTWSGLRLFRGLDTAFSRAYGEHHAESLPEQLRDAAVVLGAIGVAVAAVLAIGGYLPETLPAPLGDVVAAVSLPVALTAAFLPMFYVFPDVDLTVREVVPGAVFAAICWSLTVGLFRLYARSAAQYELYGVLGGVLLLVTWLYVAAIVIILGAILNAVLAGRVDEREPVEELEELDELDVLPDGGRVDGGDGDGGDGDRTGSNAGDPGDPEGDAETGAAFRSADEDVRAPGPGAHADPDPDASGAGNVAPGEGPADGGGGSEVEELREELAELREHLDERTVHRDEIEGDLRRYVRRRLRRGHAQGWGPYLVLLYGTAMTVGGFYYLSGGWAVAAMLVIWLSTLGLYALMLLVGLGVTAVRAPGRAADAVRDWRS